MIQTVRLLIDILTTARKAYTDLYPFPLMYDVYARDNVDTE